MRRCLILALVAAIAAATDITDTAYAPGKEYVYRYEVVTTSALRAANHQIAGLKISTDVHMQISAEKVVTIKLENTELCKVNQEVPTTETVETVFEHSCIPLSQPEADAIIEQLAKPFRFEWQYGLPGIFHAESDEPYWSFNIKSGLINVFTLNLKEHNAIQNVSPEVQEIINTEAGAEELHKLFRAFEDDLVGECETIYEVEEHEEAQNVFVKKVRNYDNCKSKPFHRSGILTAFTDVYPEFEENTALKRFSHVDYLLRGTRNEYLIKDAQLTSHFSFQPFQEVESAYTATSQHLKLFNVVEEATPIELGADLKTLPALRMYIPLDLPAETSGEESEPLPEVPIMSQEKIDFLKEKVALRLTEVSEVEDLDNTVTPHIDDIVIYMQKLPMATIEEIINAYVINLDESDDLEYKKKELILDIIPTLTRSDVVPLIRNLLKRDIISVPRAVVMLNMMVLTAKPSTKTFDDLMALFQDRLSTDHPRLKKAVLLASGVVANKVKNMFTDMYMDSSVIFPKLHAIAQEYFSILESSESVEDKIEIIAALGNSGLLEPLNLIPDIERLIADPESPPELKAKAILSFRKVAPTTPKLVQSFLLPIYSDNTHLPVVRITSFLVIMKTNPSAGVMQFLTHELKKDSNLDVLTFVTSYLERLSLSEDPKMYNMTLKAKLALRDIEHVKGGFATTGVYSCEQYAETLGHLATDVKLELINVGQTPFPTNIVADFAMSIFGKKFEIAEFGIFNKGLKKLFWNLMGPVNRFDDFMAGNANIEDFLLPVSELVSKILGGVENINTKFATTDREMLSDKIVHLYMKLFDYELWQVHLQDQEIIDLINEVKAFIPELLTQLHSGYQVRVFKTFSLPDAAITLPTPCGLPMSLNMTFISTLKLHGNVHLEGLETLFSIFSEPTPVLRLITDLHPSMASTTFLFMSTHLPHIKNNAVARFETLHKMAVKSEFVLDVAEKKIKMVMEPPQTDSTVHKFRFTPRTVTEVFTITPTEKYPTRDITMLSSAPLKKFTSEVWGQGLHRPYQVVAEYPYAFSWLKPQSYFVGPFSMDFNFLASEGAPEKFEMEVQYVRGLEKATVGIINNEESGTKWTSWFSFRSSTRDVTSLTFDPIVHLDNRIDPITKREIFVVMRSVGGLVEKQTIVKLLHIADPTYIKNQINLQVLSSPLLTEATLPIKVVVNALVTIPEFFYKFVHDVPVPTVGPQLLSTVDIKYGFTDTVRQLATWKMLYRRETEVSNPSTPNEPETATGMHPITLSMQIPHMYRDDSVLEGILNATQHGKLFYKPHPNQPLEFIHEFDYEYETLPKAIAYIFPVVHQSLMKFPYLMSNKAKINVMPAENEVNKIKLTTILDPLLEETRVVLELPHQTNKVYGLPLPFEYFFKNFIYSPILPKLFTEYLYGDIPAGWCSVTPDNYVHTYDLLSMKLPENMCEVVLAKDCSPLNMFLVTMKATETGKKIVNLYLPNNKMAEFIPGDDNSMHIMFDSELVSMPEDGSHHVITEPDTDEELLRFIPKFNGVLAFSRKYGLILDTDHHQVSFKPAEFYRSQMCGICGNFDGDIYHELEGPNAEIYSDQDQFMEGYTIPAADGCAAYTSTFTCEPTSKNIVFERYIDGEQNICISTEPITQCTGHCEAATTVQQSQAFHCMPAYLSAARHLRDDARSGPLHLTSSDASIHEDVTIHQECVPAY